MSQAVVITRGKARRIRELAGEISFFVEQAITRLALDGVLEGLHGHYLVKKAVAIAGQVGLMHHAPRKEMIRYAGTLIAQAENFVWHVRWFMGENNIKDEFVEDVLREIVVLTQRLKSMKGGVKSE